jgi:hypothetical protein
LWRKIPVKKGQDFSPLRGFALSGMMVEVNQKHVSHKSNHKPKSYFYDAFESWSHAQRIPLSVRLCQVENQWLTCYRPCGRLPV